MNSMQSAKFYQAWICTLAVLLLVLSGCRSEPEVSIRRFGPVEPGGTVEVNKGIGIAVEVHNPDNVPLTYRWITSRGTVRVSSKTAPAGTYEAADTPGVETVTVEVFSEDQVVAQKTIQIEVVATAVAVEPSPPPTPTDTPAPPATDTPTPPPANTPTLAPTETPVLDTPIPTDTLTPTPTSPLLTPSSLDCVSQPSSLPPLSASETVIPALRTDQPPTIDGCLDDKVWSQVQPLTYASHPPANDSTTMTIWLAWDDKFLYAGFDVSDTQVEESFLPDNVFDGDSVGVIIENGGRVQEHRLTMRGAANNKQELDVDRAGTTNSQAILKGATTLNISGDEDEGYTVEMRIPWENPIPTEGSTIPADLWSIDHDDNPGERYDHPDTIFSKISWDGDLNVTTAGKSILLSTPPPATAVACPFEAPFRSPVDGPPVEVQASITSIENCADDLPIDTLFPLSGTYTGDVTGKELWMLVYTPNLLYFPQAADICANQSTTFANGQWTETIRLGGPESPPETYHIVAVVVDADSPASQAFHNYLREGCETDVYKGLNVIPAGATELDSIIVRTDTLPIIELPPTVFEKQASNEESGIVDEFIFRTTEYKEAIGLPVKDGIDLSDYDLEFTFQGGDEKEVQLWYKSAPNFDNLRSLPKKIISDEPIRYNPVVEDSEQSDSGFDFAHIWAIGARISGGVEGVELTSARLVKR